ncbi:MAG: hypothetical protein AAF798_09055 [Bacteroidota bacterium]
MKFLRHYFWPDLGGFSKQQLDNLQGLSLLLALTACQPTPPTVQPSFYHWKSNFQPSHLAEATLQQLAPQRLYVRFFDVDWDFSRQAAIPKGEVQLNDLAALPYAITPTLFITNRTLKHLPKAEIPVLAERIIQKIQRKAAQANAPLPTTLQLDCDWTQSTRDAFFTLLRAIRESYPELEELSATIRLHQLRDRNIMGIPPIDRGMLMYYNMGDLEDWEEENSILNLEKAAPYEIGFRDYPLPLDLALPIYSWGLVFRQDRFLQIINDLRSSALTDTTYFEKIAANRYRIRKSTYLNGGYLYAGDQIRVEEMTPALVGEACQHLSTYFDADDFTVAFYHLDSANLNVFNHALLEHLLLDLAQ